MVVFFCSLLTAFLNSCASLFYMVAFTNSGDIDISLMALPADAYYESANYNYYQDA